MTKIDANFPVSVPAALSNARRASTGAPAGAVAGAAGTGAVGATAAGAAETPRTSAAPAPNAPFDTAKVARVRAALLDGSYKPDAGRIAQRMLDLERKLP